VAESSESFRAADRQQFYVSVSRFKEALAIYTDDKGQLLEAVSKTSERPSATDLITKQIPGESERIPVEKRHDSKNGEAVKQTTKPSQVKRPELNIRRTLPRLMRKRPAQSLSQSIGM